MSNNEARMKEELSGFFELKAAGSPSNPVALGASKENLQQQLTILEKMKAEFLSESGQFEGYQAADIRGQPRPPIHNVAVLALLDKDIDALKSQLTKMN